MKILYDFELLKITNIDIQNCVDSFIKDGLKISTIKKYLSTLHFIFNYAKKKKLILENPVSDIDEKNRVITISHQWERLETGAYGNRKS